MNTDEAVTILQKDNDDLILVRIAGSTRIEKLPIHEYVRDWLDRDNIIQAGINKLKEIESNV